MPEFDTSHVKNIALLGHTGSGKTTLAECMLYEAGLINRRGSIEEGNTIGDYTELEKERGNSVFSKLLFTKWRGYKINILDTPGFDDFLGEMISALRVTDTGMLLLNAANGVEVGADIIWEYTEKFKTPMVFVVNQLDHSKADFERTVLEARAHFGNKLTIVQYPYNIGNGFNAIIDVLNMCMYQYPANGGKPQKLPIPENEKTKAETLHKDLVEAIASNDGILMERYFDKGELTEDEMKEGLHTSMINHEIFPLFCASAKNNMGAGRLMGFIDNVCPPSNEMPPQATTDGKTITCDAKGPVCLFVYKTVSEAHIGDLSFFKVYSGTLKTGMELVNENTGVSEKINQLYLVQGNKRIPVNELVAGDIGATQKLRNTQTNNTLHEKDKHIELQPVIFPQPTMSAAIINSKKGEEDKLAAVLHQLKKEDPSIQVEVSQELGQTLLYYQGDMHLNMIKWKLEHLNLHVTFLKPKIAYRETIRKTSEASYRHKKQSGGAGQFAEVSLRLEPWHEGIPDPAGLTVRGREEHQLPWGGKLVYYNCIVGGVIDTRFLPSILKGVMEKMRQGPLTGSYVRDVQVSVYDGKMHPVDSNDLSFKLAGIMAFKDAFQRADPQLLEPVYTLEVLCPDELMGNIMGDLQSRRAVVEGFDTEGHFTVIKGKVPYAEMYQYSSALRSLTQGRARFRIKFDHYAPVPVELQKKLIDSYQKETEMMEN